MVEPPAQIAMVAEITMLKVVIILTLLPAYHMTEKMSAATDD